MLIMYRSRENKLILDGRCDVEIDYLLRSIGTVAMICITCIFAMNDT